MIGTRVFIVGFAGFIGFSSLSAQEAKPFPAQVVEGKLSKFTVYPHDAENGFYRGARFDRTSVIADWKYAGHTVFHAWKDKHDPTNSDDITGPCEEFRGELGYDEAKVGATFVKIGVGELTKPEEKEYSFYRNYAGNANGRRSMRADNNSTVMQMHGISAKSGYGYRLERKVETTDGVDSAGLRFTNTLMNTGTKPINTRVYNHNFFNVDHDAVGPNYALEFKTPVKAFEPKERFAELVKINDRTLEFQAPLDKGSIYTELKGTGEGGYRFTLVHKPSKLRLTVSSDQPTSMFMLWGIGTTLCPEPYFDIVDLQPGKTHAWTTNYRLTKEK